MGFLIPPLLVSPEQWSMQHFTISLFPNFQKVRQKSGENLKDLFLEANLFVSVSGSGGERAQEIFCKNIPCYFDLDFCARIEMLTKVLVPGI